MSIASARPRPLANRLLFPALAHDDPLPPLAASAELSAELYDVAALGLRAYVLPWWSKLSRYDKQLLPEIATVLVAVLRVLHARLHAVQLAPLLLRHVPAILTQHCRDYRNARRKLHTSYAAAASASLPQLFHQLQPHMAVSPDGRLDTEYFRHLLDHILRVCLPPEDCQPDAERFLVREIILKVLLNDIVPKISQPWFLQRSILDLLQLQAQASLAIFSPFLCSALSSLQNNTAISGACLALIHAYKNTLITIKRVNKRCPSPLPTSQNYADPLLTMFSEIFTLQDRAASTTLLTTARVITNLSSSFLDRLLPHLLEAQLSPAFVLSITRTAKRTLFPNGYPAPPPIEPTPEEQAEFRARLVGWRPRGALATRLLPLLLGPDPSSTLDTALDPLSSTPCNVHLVLFLLDLFILELFPELALSVNEQGSTVAHGDYGGGTSTGRDGDSVTESEFDI
ncbi:hypothetical protein C0993_004931 [Termitomyces sp. T159_Od127]|nr:hypothetical protein C0993_004931 [Termitomyces sp. T159_Od127]